MAVEDVDMAGLRGDSEIHLETAGLHRVEVITGLLGRNTKLFEHYHLHWGVGVTLIAFQREGKSLEGLDTLQVAGLVVNWGCVEGIHLYVFFKRD